VLVLAASIWLVAQTQPTSTTPDLSYLLQFGVIGLGLVAMIMGWIVPSYVLRRQREDFEVTLTRVITDKDKQIAQAWAAVARAEQQRDELIAYIRQARDV